MLVAASRIRSARRRNNAVGEHYRVFREEQNSLRSMLRRNRQCQTPAAHSGTPVTTVSSDSYLLTHIYQGDEDALAALYDRYGQLVYAIALRITHDQATAEEVVQDVFQAVWQLAGHLHKGQDARMWLIGITRHRALKVIQARNFQLRSHTFTIEDKKSGNSDERVKDIADSVLVSEALSSLSHKQRQVLDWVYYEGLTYQEIALQSGEALEVIKAQLRRGIMRLGVLLRP
jgi:RNA polymerase sigma-70 factor, ECF subfamily